MSLLPAECGECSQDYIIDHEPVVEPFFRCHKCYQGAHDCQINRKLQEAIAPLNTPSGFVGLVMIRIKKKVKKKPDSKKRDSGSSQKKFRSSDFLELRNLELGRGTKFEEMDTKFETMKGDLEIVKRPTAPLQNPPLQDYRGKTINNINSSLINNRKDYRTAVQLITGYCGLNKHLFNMKKSDTMECPLCGHREETVSHFLGQCPATTQLRGHYFNEYYLSINDIFDNIHITTIIKYTNKTKRLLEPEDIDNTGIT
ncbi:hypothetical protein ACHWQZ_G014752 [Mnemiopsis leidyi]